MFGVGGIGMNVVQGAVLAGAEKIIAIDLLAVLGAGHLPDAGVGRRAVGLQEEMVPQDDERKVEGSTGYPYSVVEGVEACTFRPREGDLYIFHPEIFHDISACFGPRNRINQGIFFAISPADNRVVTWG